MFRGIFMICFIVCDVFPPGRALSMVLALNDEEQASVMSGIATMANAVVAASVANTAMVSITEGTTSAFESISSNIYSLFSGGSSSSSSSSSGSSSSSNNS